MQVLMLGWEYPPRISGGLGRACEGLTRALADRGSRIRFVLPLLFGGERVDHMKMVATHSLPEASTIFLDAYPNGGHYGTQLARDIERYTSRVVGSCEEFNPDIIHAHDWMTFPAASACARKLKVPMVAHVHSLEQDRSAGRPNPWLSEIEKSGLSQADQVVAVSSYTADRIHQFYGIARNRITVVHNGSRFYDPAPGERERGRTVLFAGRVTCQKGPFQFVEAAARVAAVCDELDFRVVGEGDLLSEMKERVQRLGLDERFTFSGFLTGEALREAYASALVYVMPSVAEPFGLAALEAMAEGTPAIVSRQSGVAEVAKSAFLVDYWDVRDLANLILMLHRFPRARHLLGQRATEESRRLTWSAAAEKVARIYERLRYSRPSERGAIAIN